MRLKKIFSLLFLIITIFFLSAAAVVNAVEVTATIPVGMSFWYSVYDSGKDEIFMDNGNGELLVLSASSNSFSTFSMGTNLAGLAFDPAKGEIFVANEKGNNVWVISETTNNVIAIIRVGNAPVGVAYDSSRGEVFVTNSNDNTVSVISDVNNTVVATIAVGNAPQGLAYDLGKGDFCGQLKSGRK
ncbi:MAG TPA: YncE family protein [Candidatus Nanoarchaeia archaeon]|nr:YncE family protein [Candidatus Nanoarchaeia archaeon]